mmetsp:Transcript_12707/g.37238  ORF Transcript_12707/g.37238 Transcript_12707/m.37238 type:complete len:226 (+) Transcript_12707:396-1073(+)
MIAAYRSSLRSARGTRSQSLRNRMLPDISVAIAPQSAERPSAMSMASWNSGRSSGSAMSMTGEGGAKGGVGGSVGRGSSGGGDGVSGGGGGFWVTAFGFHGAAMVPAVLQELRPSGGDFVQHRLGAGTWMHVQLRSRTDQMETLAKNGRVLHGFMLGVVEGIVPSAHSFDLNAPPPPYTSAVPLKLHHSRGAEYTVLSKASSGISRRDTGSAGILTKLCEYIFGW